ncbi:MAG: protein kinase [Blastocatellia bacterium]|nr:protein kinase [Blastocatellia bacterium]MBL8196669.1 protein kinase [Blastocatellia bacterium]
MIGTKISHYTILEHIGVGGMGNVYKAFDPRLDRIIALKILHPTAMADEAKRQRFMQEARIASALNHPNIITIYEIGQEAENCFIATEFVEGQTLRQKSQGSALPIPTVLEIATQVVKAMKVAHKAGIIHRDIKPENIMIRPDGYVKVLDFGLAKLLEVDLAVGASIRRPAQIIKTENSLVLGTVRYMSPEQVQHLPIDHRSDIFSFGILLYEMLTGQLPFAGQKAIDIAYEIIGANPIPLSEVASVPVSQFQFLINRCLEKDPATRYQDTEDLLKDLRQLQRRLEVSKSNNENDLLSEEIIAPTLSRPSIVILYPDNLTGNPLLNWYRIALVELLTARLSWNVALDVVSHRQLADVFYQLSYDLAQDTDKPISWETARRVGVERFFLSSFTLLGGFLTFSLHSYEVSTGQLGFSLTLRRIEEELFTLIDEIALRIERELQVDKEDIEAPKVIDLVTNSVAALQNFETAFCFYQKNEWEKAAESFQQAINYDKRFALAYYYLFHIKRSQNKTDSNLYLDSALEHCGRVSESERLLILLEKASIQKDYTNQLRLAEELVAQYPREKGGYLFLGQAYHWRGDYERAFVIFQQALSFDNRLIFYRAQVSLGISHVAESYLDTGNFDRIEQLARNHSQNNWLTDLLLGVISYYRRDYLSAEKSFSQAAKASKSIIPGIWQARIYLLKGQIEIASEQLQALSKEAVGQDLSWCLRDLTESLRLQGRLREWLDLVFIHQNQLTALVDEDPAMIAQFWQAYFFEQIGDIEQALKIYEMALEELKISKPSVVEIVMEAWARLHLGRMLALLGNYERASELAEQIKLIGRNMPNTKIERLALFLWGTIEFYQGNYEVAAQLLEKSIWSYTNGASLAVRTLAQCLRQLKQYQKAIEILENLQPYATLNSASYFCSAAQIDLELAKTYEAKKDIAQAKHYYQKCLQYWQMADTDFLGKLEAETGLELLSR